VSPHLRAVVIHGHFYQPPRDDPWLDRVLAEPSAAPFHDWNARIEHECYGPLVANGALTGISFDFGSTLFEWLERNAPATYAGVLDADRVSAARLGGHGNAIAQPYHHVILPLATRREKVTEVRWGIADFRRRFGRTPEGMWLPETAVDEETLDVLAEEGIQFTVLAPHQVAGAPARGEPGRVRTSRGRSIALFVYDGGLAQGVAFGDSLKDAGAWAGQLLSRDSNVVSLATDGESYGHHRKGGDQVLASVIATLRARPDVTLENFSSYLARHPATQEVQLVAPTSWSCAHGVERWRSDCGCKMAVDRPSQQKWRTPLRNGLNWLAEQLHRIYERESAGIIADPWAARDTFGEVVGRLDRGAKTGRERDLLELERNALRMFTSCGWFFDDIAGIEAVQILRYAARAIDLAGPDGPALESGLLERLAVAQSNDPGAGNGRDVFRDLVRGRVVTAGDQRP
jgi:alpha-amylase/alpha-mannosidase (GH57 family)